MFPLLLRFAFQLDQMEKAIFNQILRHAPEGCFVGPPRTAGGGKVLILVIVLIVMCFAGMMLASDENDTEILPVSEEVKAYEPIIQKYAKEHGIPDCVLLIEAVMMQESGGRGTDPMH